MADDGNQFAEDRHTVTLRALAGMSLELARDLQQRAMAAESAEDAVRLSTAFHRVARGVRQTLALELKLVRYKDGVARDAALAAAAETARRGAEALAHDLEVERQSDAVRRRIDDAFWDEHEDEDFNTTEDGRTLPERPPQGDTAWRKLDAFLEHAEAQPDFLTRDFDILVIEAMDAMGADPTLLYEIRGRQPAEPTERDDVADEPAEADSS